MLKICIRSFGGGYIEKAILVFLICSYFKQLSQALNITALSYANIISFVSYICNPSIGRAEVLCLFIICSVNTAYPYLLCINSYLRLHSNLVWCLPVSCSVWGSGLLESCSNFFYFLGEDKRGSSLRV